MSDQHSKHFANAQAAHLAEQIAALIHSADCERWLSWYGPEEDRTRHDANADMIMEQLRLSSIAWGDERV